MGKGALEQRRMGKGYPGIEGVGALRGKISEGGHRGKGVPLGEKGMGSLEEKEGGGRGP